MGDERFIIEIRSEGKSTIPPVVRLRRFLKRLLRDHDFRAVSIQPSLTAGQQEAGTEAKGGIYV